MSHLHDSIDQNNLKFEYVGPTKDVRFYEYMDSEELFNAIKNNQISFNDVLKRQNEFLNKLSNVKIGKKLSSKKRILIILINFTFLEKKLSVFFKIILRQNHPWCRLQSKTK